MDTLTILKDTPVPTILIVGGLLFLLLSIVNQVGGKIKVTSKRQNVSVVIGVVLLLLGIVLYFIPTTGLKTQTTNAPTITGVTIRESTENDGLVIYQEINFTDSDGDTNYIKWDLVDISDPSERQFIQITNGTVNAMTDEQKKGTFTLGTWHCEGRVYKITLEATLFDASGNRSQPYQYSIDCK